MVSSGNLQSACMMNFIELGAKLRKKLVTKKQFSKINAE